MSRISDRNLKSIDQAKYIFNNLGGLNTFNYDPLGHAMVAGVPVGWEKYNKDNLMIKILFRLHCLSFFQIYLLVR